MPIPGDLTLEKVRAVRRSAKERVFVTNALRALRQVSPAGNINRHQFVGFHYTDAGKYMGG
ncbi:diol dehydratase reactivase ATPase-like domain-containing protein [Shigella sonnei]|uniref:diol dehydratase reactivase ATPase-like domain-containing protein n=1 Tax=Shigella sonnei TaxID=624 RepID=UPI003C6F90A7